MTAAEEATYKAGVFRVTGAARPNARQLAGVLARSRPQASLVARGRVRAGWRPLVRFPARRLRAGTYVYAVRLSAAMNPSRTAFFVSRPFKVH